MVMVRRGARVAVVSGEIGFQGGYRLVVRERLTFDGGPLVIERYGYESWCGIEKVYWYDSQPHPGEPALVDTDPHHKHIPPEIKHHRVPAPDLRFNSPNLPFLIQEIEQLSTS
jgi:hypothetical protein